VQGYFENGGNGMKKKTVRHETIEKALTVTRKVAKAAHMAKIPWYQACEVVGSSNDRSTKVVRDWKQGILEERSVPLAKEIIDLILSVNSQRYAGRKSNPRYATWADVGPFGGEPKSSGGKEDQPSSSSCSVMFGMDCDDYAVLKKLASDEGLQPAILARRLLLKQLNRPALDLPFASIDTKTLDVVAHLVGKTRDDVVSEAVRTYCKQALVQVAEGIA